MENEFRHAQFAIETREVITHGGVPIDDLPREQLVIMVAQLLRDLRKQQKGNSNE